MSSARALNVVFDTDDPFVIALHRTVLASLPISFNVHEARQGDVVVVSGRDDRWIATASQAIDRGVAGVLVGATGATEPGRVLELDKQADVTGTPVVVDSAYGADPAWEDSLVEILEDVPTCSLLDSVATVANLGAPRRAGNLLFAAFLEQLAFVEALVGSCDALSLVHRSDRQYVAMGVTGATTVTICGVLSFLGTESLAVDLVGSTRRWSARFSADAPARPSRITVFSARGATTKPLRHESSHRRCWRQLYTAVVEGGPVRGSLAEFASRLTVAAQLLPEEAEDVGPAALTDHKHQAEGG
ncbi:MAG: hypothetical protein ABSE77_07505 [Acidimicrobiales bacterium]|jgi:hypothetical protein